MRTANGVGRALCVMESINTQEMCASMLAMYSALVFNYRLVYVVICFCYCRFNLADLYIRWKDVHFCEMCSLRMLLLVFQVV